MFFNGTLQEGIGAAVQQQKRVICYVHDDTDESKKWEHEYLLPLSAPLNDHAVTLKIPLGSQEAGFLSAICPVDTAPTVVVISNGQVKQALKPPMDITEFRRQVLASMDLDFTISDPKSAKTTSSESSGGVDSVPTSPTSPISPTKAAPAMDSKEAQLAKIRQETIERHKKKNEERQRVLDKIEADKEDRRRIAAERARERARDLGQLDDEKPAGTTQKSRVSDITRLQLRFEDGSADRAEFPATDPLSSVRNWVRSNEKLPKRSDFSLRPMIGVGAATQFSHEDESKSLADLGLTPSATLIVKEISTSTVVGGVTSKIWSFILAIFMPIWSFVSGLFRKTSAGQTISQRNMQHDEIGRSSAIDANATGPGERSKKRDKPSLYNGNQTSVLPNHPSDEE